MVSGLPDTGQSSAWNRRSPYGIDDSVHSTCKTKHAISCVPFLSVQALMNFQRALHLDPTNNEVSYAESTITLLV